MRTGVLLDTVRALTSTFPWLTRYPYFGGQVCSVALVALVVLLSRALSTDGAIWLAFAGPGVIVLHSALGAMNRAESALHSRAVAWIAVMTGLLLILAPTAVALVESITRPNL